MCTKNHFNFRSLFLLIIVISFSLLVSACSDKEYDEEAPAGSNVKVSLNDPNYRPGEDVSSPALAPGQVLVVRLVYGIDEDDENNDEWYRVELSRHDSKWEDSVKIQGLSRTSFRHWDDYVFSSNNFNWQIEKDYYGTNSLDGVYSLEISGSNGFWANHNLNFKDGRWTNTTPDVVFYVP